MRKWVLLYLVLATGVSAEVRFGAERVIAPPKIGYRGEVSFGYVRVTAGDGQFLVTWPEARPDYPAGIQKSVGMLAMRVDLTGQPLDAHPIALPIWSHAEVWTGNEWLLVSHSAVRIDRHGRIAGEAVRLFDTSFQFAFNPISAVWTGSALIVATRDYSGNRLITRSFDAQLQFLEENVLMHAPQGGHLTRLATNGVTAMLVFAEHGGIADGHLAVFSRDGYLQQTRTLPPPIGYRTIVPWTDGYAVLGWGQAGGMRGYFLNGDGSVRSAILPFVPDMRPGDPALLWDGVGFTAVYRAIPPEGGRAAFYATDFDRNGTTGATRTVNLPEGDLPWLANIGRTTAVAYAADWLLQVRVAPDVPSLATVATTPAAPSPEPRETPAAAASTEHVLVAWRQRFDLSSGLNVYAVRMGRDGGPVDANAIHLGANTCPGLSPAVASDGREFLVAWRGNAFVQSVIVSRDGVSTLPGKVGRAGACMQGGVSVASNGSQYLVAWSDIHPTTKRLTIYAARVDANGTTLDSLPLKLGEITLSDVKSTVVRVASDGTGYLVVWETSGVRVAPDGTILDKKALALGEGVASGVWYNGRTYVVATYDSKPFPRLLRFRRIGSDGSGAYRFNEPALLSFAVDPGPLKPVITPACDATGCFVWWNDSILRIGDDGQTFGVSVETSNVATSAGSADKERILVSGSRLLSIHARSVFELPYSRATEIFVRPAGGGKTRVVRR